MRNDTVLSNDGTTIAYDVAGNDDRPLLLRIDGAATYRRPDPGRAAFTQRLTERFRVVSYDRRGRGASEDQDGYAVDREIEDVAAVLDAFGERLLGNRLTVDPRTLTPLVLVRIQVPQPSHLFPFSVT